MLLWLLACAFHVPPPSGGSAAAMPLESHPTDPDRPYARIADRSWFVDTGAARTVCDDDFVAALGVEVHATHATQKGEVGRVPIGRAVLRDVEIGGWRFARLPCAVRDLGTTSSVADDPRNPVVGILGANVMRHFATELDLGAGTLTLRREGSRDGVRLHREKGVGPRLVADLVVDGVKVRAVVDTGAADTYLSLTTGKVLDSYASVIQGTGPGGSAPSQVVIRSVDAVTTDGVPLAFDRFIERAGDTGLLGMSAFGRRRIVVDFPHARLRIEDPP